MSHAYFDKGELEKSLKCLKFIMREYYENETVIKSNKGWLKNSEVAYIYLQIGNIYRKTSDFSKAQKYLETAESILKEVFRDRDLSNLHFARLYKNFGKLYYDKSNYLRANGKISQW